MYDTRTDVSLKPRDLAVAHLLLRLLIGVNFFNHGFTRIGNIPGFVEQTVKTLQGSYFPEPLVRLNAYLVPIIELVVGVLIILGLSTRIALIVTSALMVMLMMGVTSVQKWEIATSQLIYGIVLFALLATCRFNWFSFDNWLQRKHRRVDVSERSDEVLSYRDRS
ncbi:DoxX family protein [Chamaesiphon polymorphus]|uniref:DoxX family protein n=1 Tax=Chamaesiphon polymorphus CCALA 037 TaxID=2107692 RepID=A0A2T1G6S4_9CYAN|nr:DoxX family protein [Chamaesiphon polymorphus]PSB52939.1 DoxX family protein [Chamaesiphon polymorphus CCALA 037]